MQASSSHRVPGYRVCGFSLTELIVTVAILGILLTIALPGYTRYVERARRADAYQAINAIMQAEERHYANHYTYTTDLTELGYAVPTDLPSPGENYLIKASPCGARAVDQIAFCVVLTAVALGGQAKDGNITLNSRGQKTLGVYDYWPLR